MEEFGQYELGWSIGKLSGLPHNKHLPLLVTLHTSSAYILPSY